MGNQYISKCQTKKPGCPTDKYGIVVLNMGKIDMLHIVWLRHLKR